MEMEIKRRCAVCNKELGEFEGHPESVEIPATRSFHIPSGGVLLYCDKCYKERLEGYEELSETIEHKEEEDKNKLYEKVLSKIKIALEKDAKEIIILKKERGYRIKYKYK